MRPSEENATLPSDLKPGRVVFKASTAAAAPGTRAHDAGTIRCQHLLLQLGHAQETLPALPHHKPLWTCVIRHHASFPPELQVCPALVSPCHDTFPAEPALSDLQNPFSRSPCAAISPACAGSPRTLIFKRRGTVLKPKVITTRCFHPRAGHPRPAGLSPGSLSACPRPRAATPPGVLPPPGPARPARRAEEGTHRLHSLDRQPPSPEAPQRAAEGAPAGRLHLRFRGRVVDALLHGRAWPPAVSRGKAKAKGRRWGGAGRGRAGQGGRPAGPGGRRLHGPLLRAGQGAPCGARQSSPWRPRPGAPREGRRGRLRPGLGSVR